MLPAGHQLMTQAPLQESTVALNLPRQADDCRRHIIWIYTLRSLSKGACLRQLEPLLEAHWDMCVCTTMKDCEKQNLCMLTVK